MGTGVCISACNGAGVCGRQPPGQTPPPQETAAEAGGVHPTGMHSCFIVNAVINSKYISRLCRHLILGKFKTIFYHAKVQNRDANGPTFIQRHSKKVMLFKMGFR